MKETFRVLRWHLNNFIAVWTPWPTAKSDALPPRKP